MRNEILLVVSLLVIFGASLFFIKYLALQDCIAGQCLLRLRQTLK